MAVILNPELPQTVAVAMGVRMLKNPTVTMEQVMEFIDNVLIVPAPEPQEVAEATV